MKAAFGFLVLYVSPLDGSSLAFMIGSRAKEDLELNLFIYVIDSALSAVAAETNPQEHDVIHFGLFESFESVKLTSLVMQTLILRIFYFHHLLKVGLSLENIHEVYCSGKLM
ncbi:uncharacterized protein [Euphorbia lathyris]|uniref:uncharacterized protein n=1 Tax=Euphorbia lathyris TaxID=212925 RepID=UPI003313C923